MNNMSATMCFTRVTDPNESIYRAMDDMAWFAIAQNGNIASTLKGRPEEAIKQWVAHWVLDRYPRFLVATNWYLPSLSGGFIDIK
jgi:hypothetical protein